MERGEDFPSPQITQVQYFAAAYKAGQNLVVAKAMIKVCFQNVLAVCTPLRYLCSLSQGGFSFLSSSIFTLFVLSYYGDALHPSASFSL